MSNVSKNTVKEVRISGYNLPVKKRLVIALTYVYGIGRSRALEICKKADVDFNKKVFELTEKEELRLRKITEEYDLGDDLKRSVSLNVKMLKDLGSYRGIRHRKNLPVRGQRTHTNARTRKGKSKPIANKKK